ncbi:MAG: hypothetical protein QM523_03055 [Candidatus Pacebacteria bacterium]|nr:hypothetical protein [Candidatus Paceibacterota bacterium]
MTEIAIESFGEAMSLVALIVIFYLWNRQSVRLYKVEMFLLLRQFNQLGREHNLHQNLQFRLYRYRMITSIRKAKYVSFAHILMSKVLKDSYSLTVFNFYNNNRSIAKISQSDKVKTELTILMNQCDMIGINYISSRTPLGWLIILMVITIGLGCITIFYLYRIGPRLIKAIDHDWFSSIKVNRQWKHAIVYATVGLLMLSPIKSIRNFADNHFQHLSINQ